MADTLIVKNRQRCEISDVEEIISSCNKEIIIILKDDSMLMIKGKNLKITSFSNNAMIVDGSLSSFTYND